MTQVIDIVWPIVNTGRIPLAHAYPLLAALSRLVPEIHQADDIGIHPIRGVPTEPRYLELASMSAVVLRAPVEQVGRLLPLSGKRLDLLGYPVRLGVPRLHALAPAPNLHCNLVTIKGYQEEATMPLGVRRQLDQSGISATVAVMIGKRRVLRVRQQVIVGFQVTLAGLSEEESLTILRHGLGGRRHLGCGLFNPTEE